jgi:hypothetical protein
VDYLLRNDTGFNNIILVDLFINCFDYMCMNDIAYCLIFIVVPKQIIKDINTFWVLVPNAER